MSAPNLAERAAEALLAPMRASGSLKSFQTLDSPQDRAVRTLDGRDLLILSSNNYLGLAADPRVIEAGIDGLRRYGAGTGSVRFICGTFTPHEQLERDIAAFLGTEDALTFVSCWNANEGLVPTLCQAGDAILSDELNHASLIDACRLSKATREVYPHGDLAALEAGLMRHAGAANRYVITDGVFSMEGSLANLPAILEICRRHQAILIVDDSHGTGVVGATGRGTHEHFGLLGQIDILTGTLGKALGGAAGGYVAAGSRVIELLRQKCRTQLFTNSLPLTVAASARESLRILREEPARVARLRELAAFARRTLAERGFPIEENPTAIIPIIVGETRLAIEASRRLLERGIFVTGFGYPVVPEGRARLRIQVSAAHREEDFVRLADELVRIVPV